MNVVNKPDSLSLTGNINPIVVATTKELTFVLKKGSEQILSQSFNPGTSGSVTIKIGDILNNQLSFTLKEATSYYLQNSIFATFTATLTDSDGSTNITFVAVRCGVNQLGDTPSEFLKYNFLTWQPTVKKVTYYTPEYLSYYAVVPGKLQIKATYQDATSETKTIVSMDAGTAVTVPLQYGTVYGIFGKLPAFYDVWYEDASGNVLSYIQRYVADNAKSENEQWILFTNSLGGVDTFRAYGEEEFTGEHTHNLVEIDDTNEEYRVDTVSKHKKYTGHLTKYERRWMQDFFPSLNKFIYSKGEARKIVIIESEDTYNDLDQAGGFSFTYKYTETDAYLNLQRNTQLPKDINIDVPDLANFTLPPRLLEFPTLSGSEGVLFPAQKAYADKWGKISLDDIAQFTIDSLLASDIAKKWTATSSSSHSHENKSILDSITEDLIKKWNSTNGNSHSHDNKSFLDQIDQNLSTKDSPTFENLKIGSGVIKWDNTHKSFYIEQVDGTPANFYATGGVSSYGAASESSPGSGINETTLWSIMNNTGTQQIAANHLATALSAYVTQSSMSALLANYVPVNHGHVWGDITDRPASLPASDVYAWAKAATKPSYAYSEITDKPSTLSGYGITDAAAKSHSHAWTDITDRPTKLSQFTNDMISTWALAASKPSYTYSEISGTPDLSSLHTHSNKALLDAINQNLSNTGTPTFSKITIGTISLAFDSVNNSLYVQKSDGSAANFYATGGVSSYGAGSSSGSGSGIDETTLWSIMGNTGTQQIAANHLATALSPYITQSSMAALLSNYALANHGHVWGDITDRPASLPASDVYAWAKTATKPSYAFSEITDKPSTLGGYGITDAMTALNINNLVTSAISAVQIGGTNLMPNSAFISSNDYPSGYYHITGNFEAGYVTLTTYITATSADDVTGPCTTIIIESNGNNIAIKQVDWAATYKTDGEFKISTTLYAGQKFDTIRGWLFDYVTINTRSVYAKKTKIELGSKASDWSPAPSDKLNTWDNAVSATKLYTARSFTIGNTAKSFDGTGNVSWSLSEIGAAAAIHSHVWADITDRPASLPASDVYAWAKAAAKPGYSYSEISGTPDLSSLHNHGNKSMLDAINQNLSNTSTPTFSKITIGAICLAFDSVNNSLYVQKSDGTSANFYATGGVSSYGAGASSGTGSGIDETTLWSIMGNTGTQQIAANHLATALSPYVTQSAMSAALINYAPINHGHVWGDITDRPSSLPASDVYSWAKAATKPSYSYSEITDRPSSLPASDVYPWAKAISKPSYDFSEITGKPSTLGGYGITDAAAKSHSHVWADITDRPASLPASDVYAWAKAAAKPGYSYTELSGTPDLSSLHTHANKDFLDAINQNLSNTGTPIFSKITIGAICLAFDSLNNSLYVQKSDGTSANFYATGGVSSYGAGSSSGSGSGIDETTLWSIMGNTGTQQIAANHLATALSPYVTQSAMSALLTNYAPINHGHVWGDITDRPSSLPASDVYSWAKAITKPSYSYSEITDKPTSLPASDVYAWAKATTKPGYAFSEITDKPVTLGGYGITDAASAASLANYLPLTGGIMTGPLIIQPNQRQIIFRPNVTWYGSFGYDTGGGGECLGIMFQHIETKFKVKAGYDSSTFAGGGAYTNMSDADLEIGAGYGKIAGNTIWHTGNDGSGSGLDADMLDGQHSDYYLKLNKSFYSYYSTSLDANTALPDGGIMWNYSSGSYWVNAPSGMSYGSIFQINNYGHPDLNAQLAWDVNHNSTSSTRNLWFRSCNNLGWQNDWQQIAFINSNVASATKLYTPRSFTIGNTAKSFDGTGNVSWSLSEIGAAAAIHSHTISQITDIGNASVSYAASAGNANTLGGWALSIIYSDSSDTSLSPNSLIVNYNTATSDNGLFSIVRGNQAKVINSYYGSSYAAQLAFGFGNNRLAYRKKWGTKSWSQWMNIDCGNADTATRLQTARSIFNIPFDGSADCNGDAYISGKLGVGHTPQNDSEMLSIVNGNIKLYTLQNVASQYTYIGSEYAHGNGNNKAEIRFAIDDSGDTCTRLTFHTADGVGTLYERMRISHNGNVGVGITSPAYKLHVSGTGYFSDALSLAATLSAAGLITANGNIKTNNYIEIGSTGIRIIYDSTNDCLKLIKSDGSAVNLLVTGGVTALATA